MAEKPMSEEREQIEVVAWFKRNYGPELAECLHHSPNGGHRNKATAGRFKLLGVRKGFPDLVLYIPGVGGWPSGLAIELKQTDSGNKCSEEQVDWLERLRDCGFDAHGPVDGMEAAKSILDRYMSEAGYLPVEGSDQ